ncbi:hypothetical protein [Salinivibrio sp. ML290]|uniref:hypothetical protein n=1 Tax=Salinivibrio sp. ML290 TaxID=1909468 RepID=UPI00098846D7|nr:hypothetical protein [Salinivibrio sp. ML290]OOE73690.1 hypothetical protein BZG23_11365 [Salinivibrio sp. ML290]
MIKQLQKQWLVWPACYREDNPSLKKAGRFDKVIGLVPQQLCLFKTFYYQCDLVAHNELKDCVKNEIEQLVDWKQVSLHFWTTKRDEQWLVSVWFWDPEDVVFRESVTHIVPALTYYLACSPADKGTLIYQERAIDNKNSNGLVSWAVTWQALQCIEQLNPLSSPLHYKKIEAQLAMHHEPVFSNADPESCTLIKNKSLEPFSQTPRSTVLSQGKCSNQFDIDNPWRYWKTMVMLFALLVTYLVADGALINYRLDQAGHSVSQLARDTAQLQSRRAKALEQEKVLQKYQQAREKQQIVARIMNKLARNLSKDVIIERFTYQNQKIVLRGSIEDTLGLLDSISNIEEVTNARLLGEVTQTESGRQEFQAELQVKEAG